MSWTYLRCFKIDDPDGARALWQSFRVVLYEDSLELQPPRRAENGLRWTTKCLAWWRWRDDIVPLVPLIFISYI